MWHHIKLLDGVLESWIQAAEEAGDYTAAIAVRGAWLAIKAALEGK